MRVAPTIELADQDRLQFQKIARSNTTSIRFARRAKIILLAAEGMTNKEIARELEIGSLQATRWRQRFLAGGVEALEFDEPRGGRPTRMDAAEIVRLTTQGCPTNATHWSMRTMADLAGTSPTTVRQIWRSHGLKPH